MSRLADIVDCSASDYFDMEAIYAVGDIHGCLEQLASLEQRIHSDASMNGYGKWAVCYLGDYVDRGPNTCGVINHHLANPNCIPHRIFLLGNHEANMLRFCQGFDNDEQEWLDFGGRATALSYGLDCSPGCEVSNIRVRLLSVLPGSHIHFLKSLRLFARWSGYLFVHAGIAPDRSLNAQLRKDLTTIREPFLSSMELPICVVHGHTISLEPTVMRHRIGVDTGAFVTGRLTAVRLDGSSPWLLTT
jgi:serine/threonine protein phosphatase 1